MAGSGPPPGAGNKDAPGLGGASAASPPDPNPAPDVERLALFQVTVHSVESTNALRRKLNESKKKRREAGEGNVSDDEEDEPIPSFNEFLSVLKERNPNHPQLSNPSLSTSNLDASGTNDPPPSINTPNLLSGSNSTPLGSKGGNANNSTTFWQSMMAQALTGDASPLNSLLNTKTQVVDYQALGPVYTLQDVSKNAHVLDPEGIPNPVLHMAHSKVYIPLSMLTTSSLNKIRNNDGLKYVKIPNSIVRQTLDPAQFGNEDTLSSDDWGQAYRNWLTLIDLVSEPQVAVGWYEHWSKMQADQNFTTWFQAWKVHDKQLRTQFTSKPFLLDPKSPVYAQSFERARIDFMAAGFLNSSSSSNHSFRGDFKQNRGNDRSRSSADSRYEPYDKKNSSSGNSFRTPREKVLCIRCGHSGHKVSECSSNDSNRPERPISVEWRGRRLVTKTGKELCFWFNIRGECANTRSFHPEHSCSLCGDANHGAIQCTRN